MCPPSSSRTNSPRAKLTRDCSALEKKICERRRAPLQKGRANLNPQADAQHPRFVLPSMNEYSQPGFGKISTHGDGMGAPTPELVEKRAREIALIDERDPEEFTDADWEQARRELLGVATSEAPELTPESAGLEEEWPVVAADTGERTPRAGVDDDEMLGQQLVEGGVEEATHDSMVEAAKSEQSQEGGFIEGA
jgi:hypothetical protein